MSASNTATPTRRTRVRAGRRALHRAAIALAAAVAMCCAAPGAAAAAEPSYTVTLGQIGSYPYPDDSPASPFIDTNGQFYFQSSASLYGKNAPRYWHFYRGTTFDNGKLDQSLSNSVNPANPLDSNGNTTRRCNNSPTGVKATYAPGTGYAERNYCDLMGVWVDPDTGDWYGLVHNEFTPVPFPGVSGFQHYDAIDHAVSKDQGRTWTIKGHAVTSPYPTQRNANAAFPQQTWDYGDGDPRLFVNYKSGYFYVFYSSRIQNKAGPAQTHNLARVARAPISGKMASGTWSKWYDGSWSQPGVGGLESNMIPANAANPNGYTAPGNDYNPLNSGTVDQQVAAGKLPQTSPLTVMNVTYDAYLGLYIGEPEATNRATPQPQQYYATDNLATQKWHLIGDSGSYRQDSWYRWIVDAANRTNSTVVGKTFRGYCSINCTQSDGQWVKVTIDSSQPAQPVKSGQTYQIVSGAGRALAQRGDTSATTSLPAQAQSKRTLWRFVADGDGSYRIVNAVTGEALGIDSSQPTQRAWGTHPTASRLGSRGPTLGQQWFVVGSASSFRLVNRYSGLMLSLSKAPSRRAETTPYRSWADTSGNPVGSGRTPGEQTLSLSPR
ncbi:MAG: RICIN domain-containing protein [Sciscionella sp.]